MKKNEIINRLIEDRENTLMVRKLQVNLSGSLGDPVISVGTLPYYEWDKVKEMEYVITYGRYLNCELMVYDKTTRKDKDFVFVKGKQKAIAVLSEIIDGIMAKTAQ